MIDRRALKAAAAAHLRSKKVTLWADYDISTPDRLDEAANWLTNEMYAVLDGGHPIIVLDHGEGSPTVQRLITENGRTITVTSPALPSFDPYMVNL